MIHINKRYVVSAWRCMVQGVGIPRLKLIQTKAVIKFIKAVYGRSLMYVFMISQSREIQAGHGPFEGACIVISSRTIPQSSQQARLSSHPKVGPSRHTNPLIAAQSISLPAASATISSCPLR